MQMEKGGWYVLIRFCLLFVHHHVLIFFLYLNLYILNVVTCKISEYKCFKRLMWNRQCTCRTVSGFFNNVHFFIYSIDPYILWSILNSGPFDLSLVYVNYEIALECLILIKTIFSTIGGTCKMQILLLVLSSKVQIIWI